MQNLLGALNAYRDPRSVPLTSFGNCRHSVYSKLLLMESNSPLSIRRVRSTIAVVLRRVHESLGLKANQKVLFKDDDLKWLSVSKCVSYEKKTFINRV